MNALEKNRLFTTLFNGFFANDARTPPLLLRYYRWTNVLLRWLTTTKSERCIAFEYGHDKELLQRVKKHCKKTNAPLYLKCLNVRKENLKKGKNHHARS